MTLTIDGYIIERGKKADFRSVPTDLPTLKGHKVPLAAPDCFMEVTELAPYAVTLRFHGGLRVHTITIGIGDKVTFHHKGNAYEYVLSFSGDENA